jgi:molybdopterin-guanine dinucleotide biosynthesis protein A
MQGVVLCGGESLRMGSDKGLLNQDGITWAESAVARISALKIPVCISVSEKQYESYSTIFSEHYLVQDIPYKDLRGPLCGILSIHEKFPGQDLFVLACDMLLMKEKTLATLQDTYQLNPHFDAFVYTNENEPEPLCAIYSSAGLDLIAEQYKSGTLKKYSMKNMIRELSVCFIPIPEEHKTQFRNFNTVSELNDK